MSRKTPDRISIPDLQKRLAGAKRPIVIDVREPKEIAESGAIPGALHIPMKKLEGRMADLPKGAELVFYCGGGGRASRAATAFLDAGFKHARFCGLRDWKKQGLPTGDATQPPEGKIGR